MKKIASAAVVVFTVAAGSVSLAGTASAAGCSYNDSACQATVTQSESASPSESPSETPSETPSESPSVYPPTETPSNDVSPPTVNNTNVTSGTPTKTKVNDEAAALPNTGGPNGLLLGGAFALLLAGGATVVVARRRQTD